MTYQSPRIYLYKITFEEVPYYYYGVHKERKYNEYYMGSPITHKWMWDFYTPKKQILQLFDFIDKGWLEAKEVETRLIRPFYNTDKWCLNESCGGVISLDVLRETGKKVGLKSKENKFGVFGRSKEKMSEDGKKGGSIGGRISGKNHKENGTGVFGRTKEQKIKDGKKGAQRAKELGVGIFAMTAEELSQAGKKSGISSIPKQERIENGKKGGKIVSSQRWECCETGYVSTAAGVVAYQRARGIDTSNRRRIA